MEKPLTERIEMLRNKLNRLIELYGTQNEEVLKCSQELDILIHISYAEESSRGHHKIKKSK